MFWQEEDPLSVQHLYGDTEALQTDIQRFLAIIGLCLMAMFALVQAIPLTDHENDMPIEDLNHAISLKLKEIDHLNTENERLRDTVDRLTQTVALGRARAKDLEDSMKELEGNEKALTALAAQKEKLQDLLVERERVLEIREREIEDLKAREEQLGELLEEAVKREDRSPGKEEVSDLNEQMPSAGEGVYVAFESVDVFMDLLNEEKIYLFIKVAGVEQGFRVFQKEGVIGFELGGSADSLDLWEIREGMVPAQILQAFRAWTTLSARDAMFIVGLTPEISAQVRGSRARAGRILIGEEGRVKRSPSGG